MKNSEIKVMVSYEVKQKFLAKCLEAGLSQTAFIEKVSNEPIVFLDNNTRALIEALSLVIPQRVKSKVR